MVRQVDVRDGKAEHYLDLGFDLVRTVPLEDHEHLWLRSSCQVGDHRIFDSSPMSIDRPMPGEARFVYGARNRIVEHPYLINTLRGAPGQCEFALLLASYVGNKPDEELGRFCAGEKVLPGPCPPNPAAPPPSGPPVTVDQLRVSISPASDLFPAALLLEYVITAQAAMRPDAKAHLVVQCGGSTDDVYHQELEHLVAGESIQEGQLKFQGRIPPESTPCDVTFRLAHDFDTPGEEFAHFCYVDTKVSRGACAR